VPRSTTLLAVAALTLLGLVAASCLVVPAGAELVLGTISVEDPTTHLHDMNITVGSTFKVDVWARNIPEPGVVDLHFTIVWDSKLIGFVSRGVHDHGFGVLAETIDSDRYEVEVASPFPHSPFIRDASWVTLTFRCLGEGSSGLIITYSHGYYGDYGHEFYFSPEDARVNQHAAPPPDEAAYGVEEVAMLSPRLAVVGIVGCIAIMAQLKEPEAKSFSSPFRSRHQL